MLLADRVVIVSGVGPGLGRALALRCAEHGAKVVLVARSTNRLDQIATEIEARGGISVPVPADASSRVEVERVVGESLTAFGRIDGLINNATVIPPLAPVSDVDDDVVRTAIDGNFATAYHLTRAVLPTMRARSSTARW